jgi:hypothetical protein
MNGRGAGQEGRRRLLYRSSEKLEPTLAVSGLTLTDAADEPREARWQRSAHAAGSSSSRTENSGVTMRECGYTR